MPSDTIAVQGLTLSRAFYVEVVEPIMSSEFPVLSYAAGLIGWGSEVLSYDSVRSQDHNWGPRVILMLRDQDLAAIGPEVDSCLAHKLPVAFSGFSTNFTAADANRDRRLQPIAAGPVRHMIEIHSVRSYAAARLGIDTTRPLSAKEWLLLPQQRLLEATRGAIFRDDVGEITTLRESLAYFPRDVWIYLLASQWQRISHEEAFVGRTAEAGDELGSHLIASRLVRELMRLCFLIERRYWPYGKWFGTAFAELVFAKTVMPIFADVLAARDVATRGATLSRAYEEVAARFNDLAIVPPVDAATRPYFTRPYAVLGAKRFAAATRNAIGDPELRALPLIGSTDQCTDCSDLAESTEAMAALAALYR